jgi:hypothetical protein
LNQNQQEGGFRMPAKKTEKAAGKKAAARVGKLVLDAGAESVATLMTPLAEAAAFNGRVHYAGIAAVLVAPGSAYLLIMFKPAGNYTPADVGAAASHLRFALGKQEGAPLSVNGHAGNIFGKACIFMMSAS